MRFKSLLLASCLTFVHPWPGFAIEDTVVVMTGYPQDVISAFERGFAQAHPGTRIEMRWAMGQEALAALHGPAGAAVDVYWAAAPQTFRTLKAEGALKPLRLDPAQVPPVIGRHAVSDKDG
ncbi:MAG: hypothetical protein K2Q10_12500, partial [Rhodospirillales bacterium]|nr:hypothetical protein [Rhodospirillales bacterium]